MQFKFYFFFFQFIIFYDQCNIAKALTGRQVRHASPGEYPFVVSIQYTPDHTSRDALVGNGHRCTGTLITRTDILTIGTCLQNYRLDEIRIIAGSIDLRTGAHYVPAWWIHYNEFVTVAQVPVRQEVNDFAYLKLTNMVSADIQLAVITNNTVYDIAQRSRAAVAGWCRSAGQVLPRLRKGNVRILTKEDCDRGLAQVSGVQINTDDRLLCSFNAPPISFDDGDSGDPTIMADDELVAIALVTCPNLTGSSMSINMHVSIPYYMDIINYFKDRV